MSYYQTLHVLSDKSSDFTAVVKTAEIELCAKVALASLLFYYTITTVDKEIKYFWRNPWCHVSIIIFLNRYVGLVSIFISIQLHVFNVPTSLCTSITWIHSIADWATVLAIDYILLIRVFALFNQDIRLRSVLSSLLALEASLRLAFMIVAVNAEIEEQKHLPESTACVEQSKCSQPTLETAYCRIAPATFQIILLILVLYKSVDYWRSSKGFKGFHLVQILVRDQVIYFMVAIVCSTANIFKCYLHTGPAWNGIMAVLGSSSLLCLLGSTLLINLKEAGERCTDGGTYYTRYISDIEFDDERERSIETPMTLVEP